MISKEEIVFYKSVLKELDVVFDVGCRHKIGLGAERGTVKYYYEYCPMVKRVEPKGPKWVGLTHDYVEVQIDTLDNYCQANGIQKIDLLKIDTEGFDLEVLVGGAQILPSIKYVQFEHWTGKAQKITSLLQAKGFEVKELGGRPMNGIATNKNI